MATQAHTLTDLWQDIGQGPLLIETKQFQHARLHFGQTAPPADSAAFHDLPGPGSFSYGGQERCFARAAYEAAQVIVTEAG